MHSRSPGSDSVTSAATTTAGADPFAVSPLTLPTRVMGLTFDNALGLAAGIDRTGAGLTALAQIGVGHVEVGTVTDARDVAFDRASLPAGFRVGINFASPRAGLAGDAIEDYVALMRVLWPRADYLVANLSSPSAGRTGDTPGVESLLARLAEAQCRLTADMAPSRPLLIKIPGGQFGTPMPRAVGIARQLGLQGVVLVTSCVERISECCDAWDGAAFISVEAIATAEDASARLAAGARLVQIHTAFATGGPAAVRGLLDRKIRGGRAQ